MNGDNSYRGVGLMSGTSLDGVDLAYCEFREEQGKWQFDLLDAETIPYDETWQASGDSDQPDGEVE